MVPQKRYLDTYKEHLAIKTWYKTTPDSRLIGNTNKDSTG